MQESIDKHFPQQNDPNREPNWNGKHKGLRTSLIVLELLHQGKDFLSKKEKEQEQEQNQNQERTPEGKNEYFFQPENSNNSEEPSHNGTNWIESLNNHMNSRLS